MENVLESLKGDLKKFEADVEALNKKLEEGQSQKDRLITIGRRLEGAISYIRQKIDEMESAKQSSQEEEPAK